MAAEQGKDMRAGHMPALNIERIYSTTVSADELARALADHFRAQGFEAQVFLATGDRTVMQARDTGYPDGQASDVRKDLSAAPLTTKAIFPTV